MNIVKIKSPTISRLLAKVGITTPARQSHRNYAGAVQNNLTADWLTSNRTADEVLKMQLPKLRERSRDLARNNDYVKAFFRYLKINVIGPEGIRLQSKVKNAAGKPNVQANKKIEDAWKKWSKKKNASVTKSLSWLEQQWQIIESVARDGEVFIRKVEGYDNEFRFALQMIEPDHIDVNFNVILQNGNTIKMGIEYDSWKKPIAYHVTVKHPGDSSYFAAGLNRTRIPAEEINHFFIQERESQSRGVPWLHTAIIRLRNLGGYEEAALIAARIGASKAGFYTSGTGDAEYTGDDKDKEGNLVNEIEPGQFEKLPFGIDFKPYDPTYPHQQFGDFIKAALRGASSGMGILYNNLANDLEGVSFSSIRQGTLGERDMYRILQTAFAENVNDDTFEAWLPMAFLTQQIKLPIDKIDHFNAPKWQTRGWDWVDPKKDAEAAVIARDNRMTSLTQILHKRGLDFDDLMDEIEYEEAEMARRGIEIKLISPPAEAVETIEEDKKDE